MVLEPSDFLCPMASSIMEIVFNLNLLISKTLSRTTRPHSARDWSLASTQNTPEGSVCRHLCRHLVLVGPIPPPEHPGRLDLQPAD